MSSMREGFWYDSAGRVLLIRQRAADDSVLVVAQIDGHDMSHPTWFNPGDVPPMGWSLIRPLEAQPGAPDEAKRLASELARRWLQPRLNMLHRLRGRDSMTPEEIAKARAVGRTWRSATRQLCEAFGIPEPAVPADDPSADHARELLASEADALGLAEVAAGEAERGKARSFAKAFRGPRWPLQSLPKDAPAACDLLRGTTVDAAQDGSAEIHDPRWQPGAVWEHRSVDVARFEIVRGEPDADGRIFLRGPWGDVLAKPAALSEANGWRFVGDEK